MHRLYKMYEFHSFAENYLRKHSFCSPQISAKPNPELGIIVVIPCFNEPDLISSLESLFNCDRPNCFVEVIVVINASENLPAETQSMQRQAGSSREIVLQNEKTFSDANNWIKKHNDESLKFFLLKNNFLPKKHAGVGLARKIGMDEAVARFNSKPLIALQVMSALNEKIIVCFDADSTCDKNYLVEIENHFKNNSGTPACSIYFEHPTEENLFEKKVYDGIIQYELFLRYYRQGLKYAGHPAAFHTIGSSMAVRADVYCKQGGMNKRKAGEDFYFLNKIIPLGNFTEINSARVIPSPRPSSRVPFGTGKAISDFLTKDEREIFAYHPQTFIDLKKFIDAIKGYFADSALSPVSGNKNEVVYNKEKKILMEQFPEIIKNFLLQNEFEIKLKEIKENIGSGEMFLKRFFRWFDGFKVLKFAHFARDNFYEKIPIDKAASSLLEMKKIIKQNEVLTTMELLQIFRELDKNI